MYRQPFNFSRRMFEVHNPSRSAAANRIQHRAQSIRWSIFLSPFTCPRYHLHHFHRDVCHAAASKNHRNSGWATRVCTFEANRQGILLPRHTQSDCIAVDKVAFIR
ncbi:hypothetical protein SERLA73DRAFT_180134 [Serpula lacrymans var. lacrymans S7.3]|uniref:Uncharacterized protein n=2 Tax=Serpula lacrymans var. lacrymans TaxID=341189 RepID=F8PW15_SERL3|nr:uncharacterized protein SERLADRAFT_465598 [Serpula lacrymans var. lacrymans S7.9]EGN99874.1 hypothetical protein SERLA73DRAFT_180134 [Serpula lacrymans var. lacrymans S7.3]EGO25442.1 hypothetical protein SERLADRAFT_465598 [Serpula lacrymans var. lacrymans S7.9]